MVKFNITKHFLAKIFLIITAVTGFAGGLLYGTDPQLSLDIRVIFSFLMILAFIIFEKTKPKR